MALVLLVPGYVSLALVVGTDAALWFAVAALAVLRTADDDWDLPPADTTRG